MKPDITVVVNWVKEAWDSIPTEMIKKSFLKCGIANAMDGTEDDVVFHDREPSLTQSDDDYTEDLNISKEQYDELFGDSDDEALIFSGFNK